MVYSGATLAGIILFSPVLMLAALLGFAIGAGLRLFDPDVPRLINLLLVGLLSLAPLLLYGTVEMTFLMPARFQDNRLGERIAGPLQLRRFEQEPGFMDPGYTWTYALSRSRAAALRRSCRPAAAAGRPHDCVLHHHIGDRVIAYATLTDDNRLHLSYLLH